MPVMRCLGGAICSGPSARTPSEQPGPAEVLPAGDARIGSPSEGVCPSGEGDVLPLVVGAEALGTLLHLPPAAVAQAIAVEQATGFTVRVPRAFAAEIAPGDLSDPLLVQIWPQPAELNEVEGYVADPLCEARARAAPRLIRKYRGRALVLAGEQCAIHCRFCFRRHNRQALQCPPSEPDDRHSGGCDGCGGSLGVGRLDAAIAALAGDSSLSEAILSGGDPLTLSDRALDELIERLAAVGHLRRVRIHTRVPIVAPQRVTAEFAARLRATRLTPWLVVHINHPREVTADTVAAAARLSDAGIPLLSQTVLLRGVNDRFEVLAELFARLVDHRVVPYYLHQLDPVAGAAHFAVETERGRELIRRLRAELPGYAVPRYVQETPGAPNKVVLE